MLLDRIDIDVHGPLNRVELGPFSEQLNVVCGPDGSGKTAIARFVRDSLVQRQYPLGMMSSSTGRIVWADRDGMVHCVREKDGTALGRTTIEFEPRGDQSHALDSLKHSWISGVCDTSDRSRATAAIAWPEPLVDGVITDTAVTNLSRVVAACVQSGLDDPNGYRAAALNRWKSGVHPQEAWSKASADQPSLRAELADVEAEIARLDSQPLDYQTLIARRNHLQERLAKRWDQRDELGENRHFDRDSAQRRLTVLCEHARELRSRQSVLRRWLASLDDPQHPRDAMLDPYYRWSDAAWHSGVDHLSHRSSRSRELDRVNVELDACLAEAAEIRRALRNTSGDHFSAPSADRWTDREAIRAELRRVDQQLATLSRLDWLGSRRRQLISRIDAGCRPQHEVSPLSAVASRWLVRLSAGRLRRIDWPARRSATLSPRPSPQQAASTTGVRIDGRDEFRCHATDRALAVIAVRMAAADLLAARGRQVPLLLETHRDLLQASASVVGEDAQEYSHHGPLGQTDHAITAALCDFARAGRQVIVLTSDETLATQIGRSGGRSFQIQSRPVIHAHRPIWRPHYAAEEYVGPHPHTYGSAMAPAASPRPVVDINRDFDVAWREAYGFDDAPESAPQRVAAAPQRVAAAVDGSSVQSPHRDGYYYANSYTTVPAEPHFEFDQRGNWISDSPSQQLTTESHVPDGVVGSSAVNQPTSNSPFFLSVDSPIDQAPSIDAVAAARLRGLSVSHINHLMQQDSNRLADALGLASVSAATIRRWQAECRLVCRVPQLRGFDARVLVGCGISDPAQLAAIHPADLLQEVEAFLATERGQRILLSGSSQELSRITSWIAAANSSPAERAVAEARGESDEYASHWSVAGSRTARQAGYDVYRGDDAVDSLRSTGRGRREDSPQRSRSVADLAQEDGQREKTAGSRARRRRRRQKLQRGRNTSPATVGGDRSDHSQSHRRSRTGAVQSRRAERKWVRLQTDGGETFAPQSANTADQHDTAESWRFYLHRDSPLVDAPSIGERMAERFEAIGIHTVDDLLTANPDSVAEELGHRRVDGDRILQWQQQAELVCRVPMLRGHDAQLLVMAEVTTPEDLAAADAEELFARIGPISRSKEGVRVIRGGKLPDLAEVTEWIGYAQHTRELVAA